MSLLLHQGVGTSRQFVEKEKELGRGKKGKRPEKKRRSNRGEEGKTKGSQWCKGGTMFVGQAVQIEEKGNNHET